MKYQGIQQIRLTCSHENEFDVRLTKYCNILTKAKGRMDKTITVTNLANVLFFCLDL